MKREGLVLVGSETKPDRYEAYDHQIERDGLVPMQFERGADVSGLVPASPMTTTQGYDRGLCARCRNTGGKGRAVHGDPHKLCAPHGGRRPKVDADGNTD